jgi:hypothetical protein
MSAYEWPVVAADYPALRRWLGYKLERARGVLTTFVAAWTELARGSSPMGRRWSEPLPSPTPSPRGVVLGVAGGTATPQEWSALAAYRW